MIRNLKDHIFELAEAHPETVALLSCDETGETKKSYTYSDLKKEILKTGSWFQKELGLHKGDAIGLALPNSVDLLILSWSAWAQGIVTVPLDMKRDTFQDYLYKLGLTQPKALVTQGSMFSQTERETLEKSLSVVEVGAMQNQKSVQDGVTWEKGISQAALILFTSGTTSKPKGVELSLENLLVNAEGIKEWFGIAPQDRFLVLLPLYHINSTTFCLASLLALASIAVPPGYSNSKFWQQLANTQATFTSIVPTICFDQLSRAKEFEAVKDQLRITKIQIGSAPVVPHDAQKFVEQFHVPLYQGYGQTETALRVTGVPLGIPKDLYLRLVKENSIGKSMNWAEVEVMDAAGNILKENEEGEIAVKGKAVTAGYIANASASSEAFKHGYFLTGDIGYYKTIDGARYFFLKGRSKEIIIKGGVNLSPVAIESKLKGLNENIEQAYVVGLNDERYGEEVGAVICWKETGKPLAQLESELRFQLTGPLEELVPYEVPRYMVSLSSKDLPMTSTGKVQRSVLKTTLPKEAFQAVNLMTRNETYEFVRLTQDEKPRIKEALLLYNYCWGPLVLDEKTFFEQIKNGVVLVARNKENVIEGMVTFLRTGLSHDALQKLSYREVTGDYMLKNNQQEGDKIICVSICTKAYQQPGEVEPQPHSPTPAQMEEYLQSGKDLTYNFHKKPKGGILGADLVALLPNGRPEDRMALGYNMLLKYPTLSQKELVAPDTKASLAVQLLEAAMYVAQVLGVKELYAFSRPAGAYQYFSKQ